ncbi:MAG TPA: type II secretion system F family protein [Solirubrobacteraceae bacterium]|nr:type II secretion system F family protein [Solirubrobacteraceae bacterium]
MATYVFKAVTATGAHAEGEVEADSRTAVSEQLAGRGLIVLEVAAKHASREIQLRFLNRVSADELAIFSRQLATMITSGMSILRCLYVLEEQSEGQMLKETLGTVRRDVEAGQSFSKALARHPRVFNPLFIAMSEAGEAGGVLDLSLRRVADQLQRDAALRRQVRSAMVYPVMVITFAIGVMMALVAFLVPVFVNVFKQFGGELPFMTKISVMLSHAVIGYWWLMIGGTVVIVLTILRAKRTVKGRRAMDRMALKVPMKIGGIVQQIAVARWSRTLASLVGAGVPLLLALEITGRTAGNAVVNDAMTDVINSVKAGGTLAAPLARCTVFPPMVTRMVGVGEETGALDTMLDRIAEFYEEQVEASVKALTSILEPIMIILIGSIVGFIVISMYLPLFELYNHVE